LYANVQRAEKTAGRLTALGFSVILPHEDVRWRVDLPYERWMKADFALVRKADVVYRMEGPSKGADRETSYAKKLGIPVVHSIEELLDLRRSLTEITPLPDGSWT